MGVLPPTIAGSEVTQRAILIRGYRDEASMENKFYL